MTIEEFFSVAATQNSQPVEIIRGEEGYSLGTAKAGEVFSASQEEDRLLLWSNGFGVFFMVEGQIYKQQARWFSEDVILGAFIKGAQSAIGSMIISQLMVEIALSFTPGA